MRMVRANDNINKEKGEYQANRLMSRVAWGWREGAQIKPIA